jgi:hypothetical protein
MKCVWIYYVLAENIYQEKLYEFVFYNLKPVKPHATYVTEQIVTQDITWDNETKDEFNYKPRL